MSRPGMHKRIREKRSERVTIKAPDIKPAPGPALVDPGPTIGPMTERLGSIFFLRSKYGCGPIWRQTALFGVTIEAPESKPPSLINPAYYGTVTIANP